MGREKKNKLCCHNAYAILVGDFNIPLSTMDGSFTQKISKETLDLDYTIDQMYLLEMHPLTHSKEGHRNSEHSEMRL